MLVRSSITNLTYDEGEGKVVYYKNPQQSAAYIRWGATLLDLQTTSDNMFVYVFSMEDHKKYIVRWNAMKGM